MNRRALVATAVIAFSGALLLEGQSPGDEVKDASDYVGAIVCRDCHNQDGHEMFRVWSQSKHSRTWIQLRTGSVERIEPTSRGLVPDGFGRSIAQEARRLNSETNCFKCHTTASDVPEGRKATTFHTEDGVQCEACHGPGGRHVEAAAQGRGAGTVLHSNLEICEATCHRPKPSHAPFIDRDFEAEKAWAHIAH